MTNEKSEQLTYPSHRKKLAHRKRLYAHRLGVGKFLGYKRTRKGPGTWTAYIKYGHGMKGTKQRVFAFADDESQADGEDTLTFEQAVKFAYKWCSNIDQSKLQTPRMLGGARSELIVCPCGPIYTVNHALEDYLAWKRVHEAIQSFVSSLYRINRYIVPTIGAVAVEDLIPQHFYDMMHLVVSTPTRELLKNKGRVNDLENMDAEALRKRRVSANHVMCTVRAALVKAWEDGKVADDSAWRRVKLFKGVAKPRADMLTLNECLQLLHHCEPHLRQLVLGALYTGCRVTELCNIRAEDLNEQRLSLYIRPLKNYRGRHLALPEEGYKFFRALVYGKGKDDPIFCIARGKPWNGKKHISEFKEALAKAGLSNKYVFHSLRHTYASLLIQNNASPLAVARQLGHQGLQTVMRTYAHCADDFVDREIREKFEPILGADTKLATSLSEEITEGIMSDQPLRLVYAALDSRSA